MPHDDPVGPRLEGEHEGRVLDLAKIDGLAIAVCDLHDPGPRERVDDQCYLYAPDEYRDWDEATEMCVEKGGWDARLASIHSQERNNHIWTRLVEISETPTIRGAWIGMVRQTIGT